MWIFDFPWDLHPLIALFCIPILAMSFTGMLIPFFMILLILRGNNVK